MKEFTGKTVEEVVASACEELGVAEKNLVYVVTEEKKGLFKKSATIQVFDENDACEYALSYLKAMFEAMNIEVNFFSNIEDGIVKITIDSPRNPILIGRAGRTLQALNELTKLAVSNKFHHRFRVLLDVGGYKESKYEIISKLARKTARDVIRTKTNVKMRAMTPDERRVVHNALSGYEHIATESEGDGPARAVVVKYVD